jgi:pantothenate kinase
MVFWCTADVPPWTELTNVFDDSWFIECDLDLAMKRVVARHVAANNNTPEVAQHRVHTNDRPNAEVIATSINRADIIVPSLPVDAL